MRQFFVFLFWGQGCDGWYLVKNAQMTAIQERMPPGAAETLHKQTQSTAVLLRACRKGGHGTWTRCHYLDARYRVYERPNRLAR
jgi:hypothetical protein